MRVNKNVSKLHDTRQTMKELLLIMDELFYFSIEKYDHVLRKETEKLLDQMNVPDVLFDRAFPQIVWWLLFCKPHEPYNKTIYQDYLKIHNKKWGKADQIVQNQLTSWFDVIPGFYLVVRKNSYNDRLFHVQDVFCKKEKKVYIFNEIFQSPKIGEVISGLLLPIGDNLYTTEGRLLHFPIAIVPELVARLRHYVKKQSSTRDYVVTALSYPDLLRIAVKTMEENL